MSNSNANFFNKIYKKNINNKDKQKNFSSFPSPKQNCLSRSYNFVFIIAYIYFKKQYNLILIKFIAIILVISII